MSKMGQTIIEIQEYVDSSFDKVSKQSILDRIVSRYGIMFEDIAKEYMYSKDFGDEENDVDTYDELLEELRDEGFNVQNLDL